MVGSSHMTLMRAAASWDTGGDTGSETGGETGSVTGGDIGGEIGGETGGETGGGDTFRLSRTVCSTSDCAHVTPSHPNANAVTSTRPPRNKPFELVAKIAQLDGQPNWNKLPNPVILIRPTR